MAQSVEKSSRTVEEAVQEALACLNLPRDSVDIEVLEEPTRGVLGLIGQRPARVRVTAKVDAADKAKEFLGELLDH
ncbi:MAG: Jag N-terminal domain-containing protein, partial [Bacillota bacterium]